MVIISSGILRETYPIPPVDDTLAQVAGAAVFSKVDANSGFWQIPLADDSQLLTTFITPHGRYCFRKLPHPKKEHAESTRNRVLIECPGIQGTRVGTVHVESTCCTC